MLCFTALKMKVFRTAATAAAALAVTVFASVPAFASNKAGACTILVMGDSLSAAYGIPVQQGWVALMEARLDEKFPHCKVVNASVSGETTAGGRTRLPDLLIRHKPSHVVLELGANDGLRGLSLDAMEANLREMMNASGKANAKVVLVGMMIPPNYGPAYTKRFSDTFSKLAKEKKAPLVPFLLDGFAQDPSAFQTDGIHPNAGAQPQMLNNVWPALEKTLPRRPA